MVECEQDHRRGERPDAAVEIGPQCGSKTIQGYGAAGAPRRGEERIGVAQLRLLSC